MSHKAIILLIMLLTIAGCSSKTKEELYAEGVKQIKDGNPNGAIVFLKNALEKDQNYLDARYQLAKAYLDAGKFEQAEKEFQKVIRQNPSRDEIMLDLARIYNATKKPELAIDAMNKYLKSHQHSSEALEILGIGYALKNRLGEAENCLLQALKEDPRRSAAKLDLARIYIASGREREARQRLDEIINENPKSSRAYYMLADLENAAGHKDRALEIYQTILRIDKFDTTAVYKSGLIYIDKGETDKAQKLAAYLLQNYPNRPEGNRLAGLVYYYRKNYTEAIAALQNSLKTQPNMEAYYFLGLSLYNRGEFENALNQFRKILDYNPSFIQARLLTGVILLKQGRVDDSIGEIGKILELDDKYAIAHNILGSAYMAKGMYEEGMKELTRTTELDPKIIDAHLKKGIFNLSKGKTKEAETDLRTAVRVAPEILNTRLILSSYYLRQNDHAKALSAVKEGLVGAKSDAVLYNTMASIKFADGRPDEGLKLLQKAKETDPNLSASYFNMATYFAGEGAYEKALNEYRSVLQRDPKNIKALLGMAALSDMKGRDDEALAFYKKARETKAPVAYIALANYYIKKNDSSSALSVLNEAIKAIPRNTTALELKGRVYLHDRKYKDAITAFDDIESISSDLGFRLKVDAYVEMKDFRKAAAQARRYITIKPDSAYGYMVLASVYEKQNNVDRALEEVKNGLRVDGKNVQATMLLGNLLARKKDNVSAMKAFREAAGKNPDYAPAYFAQGALLDAAGNKREAIKKYLEALEKAEDFVPALNNLAYSYADGYGSKQDAVRLAVTAFRLEPGNPAVMDTLGYVLLKNGRNAEALKLLKRAADLLPNDANIRSHLSAALKANGGPSNANLRQTLR